MAYQMPLIPQAGARWETEPSPLLPRMSGRKSYDRIMSSQLLDVVPYRRSVRCLFAIVPGPTVLLVDHSQPQIVPRPALPARGSRRCDRRRWHGAVGDGAGDSNAESLALSTRLRSVAGATYLTRSASGP